MITAKLSFSDIFFISVTVKIIMPENVFRLNNGSELNVVSLHLGIFKLIWPYVDYSPCSLEK